MNENISITLHISEVEDIIEDLYFSARKLNAKYEQGAGDDQKNLANKIDSQLQTHFKNAKTI